MNLTNTGTIDFKIGDLVEVIRNDDKKFNCIIVENYDGAFVGKIISKDEGVGTATWSRYGLIGDSRFQTLSECKEIKVISESSHYTASSTLTLNESVSKNNINYYETKLNNGKYILLCLCEGFGGWSIYNEDEKPEALKESFFGSQISKINNKAAEQVAIDNTNK